MIQAMLVTSAIKIAAEFFPTLANKIGGKNAESVAEQVVSFAREAAGAGRNATTEAVIARLHGDPQAQAELRLKLEALDTAEHQRILADRQDARAYQSSVGAQGRMRSTIMLVAVSIGLIACVISLAYYPDGDGGDAVRNATVIGLITTIAGAFLKMFSDAFAFEFGSSRGSKEKSDQINTFARKFEDAGRENTRLIEKVLPGGGEDKAGGGSRTRIDARNADRVSTTIINEDQDDAPQAAGAASAPAEPRPFVRMLVDRRLEIA